MHRYFQMFKLPKKWLSMRIVVQQIGYQWTVEHIGVATKMGVILHIIFRSLVTFASEYWILTKVRLILVLKGSFNKKAYYQVMAWHWTEDKIIVWTKII